MKVNSALTLQTSHARRELSKRAPKSGDRASRAAPAIENRRATPVRGGIPRSPTRIAAQVVPQIRTSVARETQVRRRDGFSARLYG